MRVICIFDLPSVSHRDRKDYYRFRKALIKDGFYMLQESMYCKMVLNYSVAQSVVKRIHSISPGKGIIQVMIITEKQFSDIILITGEVETNVVNSDERILFI